MKRSLTVLIDIYQKTLSPDHGMMRVFFPLGACRFYPSCSEYTKKNIERYGVVKGIKLGLTQFLRCRPFNNSKFKVKNSKLQFKV